MQITTKQNFCAIDFETACFQRASACAVGMVRIKDGEVAETLYALIKPPEGMEIIDSFTNIHGITMADVKNSLNFDAVWASIRDFIGNNFLVAHNASFDRSVLECCLDYYGIAFPIPHFTCTVQCSRLKWPELDNHRLDTVCDYLGIDLVHHEALSDALACAKIFLEAQK